MFASTTLILLALQAIVTRAGPAGGIKLPPEPADKTTPVQTRLSFKSPSSVSVAWNTFEHLSKPCVQYSTDKGHLAHTKCSKISNTYPTSRTWNNLVHLTGLMPGTVYYYRIGSTNSTIGFFQTARKAGDMTPFTMNTLADLGLYGDGKPTVTKREEIPNIQPSLNHTTIGLLAQTVDDYEFILHPGDFAYADDWMYNPNNTNGQEAYTAIIERFYDQLSPITSRKPYMVSPGNHEADCTEDNYHLGACPLDCLPMQGQYNFSDFTNRFQGMMPNTFSLPTGNSKAAALRKKATALAKPPYWYSFDYGMVHVVMINTETDYKDAIDAPGGAYGLDAGPFGFPGEQHRFLEADLASVDRTITPWVVAAGHRPWYTNGGTICKACQAAFENVFYKYAVDLAAFGHIHNLQRFNPIFNNTEDPAGYNNPKAPMYTIIGGAGNIEGHSGLTPVMTGNAFAYNAEFGFGSLTFHNKTHLTVKLFESETGATLDSATLYKAHDVAFPVQALPKH